MTTAGINGEGGPERTARVNGGVGSGAGAQGREEKLGSRGRVCVTLPGSLRMGRCRLDSAPITSVTAERGGWRRHSGECPRPIWTWASSRRRNLQMASTPAGRPATKSLRRMRRADTTAASHFSTASHPTSWWRRWRGAGLM